MHCKVLTYNVSQKNVALILNYHEVIISLSTESPKKHEPWKTTWGLKTIIRYKRTFNKNKDVKITGMFLLNPLTKA